MYTSRRSFMWSFCLSLLMFSNSPSTAQSIIQTNADRELIPEGIAVDSTSGRIYVTSIFKRKIIITDATGKARDFIARGHAGFLKGVGIKIDYKRRWLWAVSYDRDGDFYVSRIHAFQLADAKLVQYDEIRETSPHLFNDIAIDVDGTLYITDSQANSVYSYSPAARKFTLFAKVEDLTYANGIAIRTGLLYVASNKGLSVFDLKTKKNSILTSDKVRYSNGFDGIVIKGNQLYGIYNLPDLDKDMAVVRYTLSKDGYGVDDIAVIDMGNAHYHAPTTAAIAGNHLYVLANSHLSEFNANKETVDGIESKLLPAAILKYNLQE